MVTDNPTALICGISGHDGAYLAQLLLETGYRVVGTPRDAQVATLTNLDRLDIRERIECSIHGRQRLSQRHP